MLCDCYKSDKLSLDTYLLMVLAVVVMFGLTLIGLSSLLGDNAKQVDAVIYGSAKPGMFKI